MTENKMLKYFWRYLGITFGIEIVWYLICFSIAYFYFPVLMRHISMVGFLIIPFITAYNTMWKQIDELESFIEAQTLAELDNATRPMIEKTTEIIEKVKPKLNNNNNKIKQNKYHKKKILDDFQGSLKQVEKTKIKEDNKYNIDEEEETF